MGEGAGAALRRGAAVAAGAALVLLVGLAVVGYSQGPATAAQAAGALSAPAAAKGKKGSATGSAATARGAASIKGLQGRVAAVMKAERKEGNIVRQAMVRKEQDEVRLETAEDGLEATAENSGVGDSGSAKALKDSHQSIQQIKDQIATVTKRAEKAKAARKKLQARLDKDLNLLAHRQFLEHAAAAKAAGKASKMGAADVAHVAVAVVRAVSGKGGSALATARAQESVLAGMEKQLLSLPKVRQALTQSLNAKELKIADEVAKSLGAQFNITGLDDDLVAEVAVATAEKEKDIPLQADGVTPAVSAGGSCAGRIDVICARCGRVGVSLLTSSPHPPPPALPSPARLAACSESS